MCATLVFGFLLVNNTRNEKGFYFQHDQIAIYCVSVISVQTHTTQIYTNARNLLMGNKNNCRCFSLVKNAVHRLSVLFPI